MRDHSYVLYQMLYAGPPVVILAAGLVLIAANRGTLAPRVRVIGIAGCGALLAGAVLSVVFQLLMPTIMRRQAFTGDLELLFAGYALAYVLLECVGLALLIAAILVSRRPAGPAPLPVAAAGQTDRPAGA